MPFVDRADAGRCLARRLEHLRGSDVVVVGLPRGGVAVAREVARTLDAPLDVFVGRPLSLTGRTVVVVDDGTATSAAVRAACKAVRAAGAAKVVVALPVAPAGCTEVLAGDADEHVCLETLQSFVTVEASYRDLSRVSDEDVSGWLRDAAARCATAASAHQVIDARPAAAFADVEMPSGRLRLRGRLMVPPESGGVVVMVDGSGCGRMSPKNQRAASALNGVGLSTLVVDLLTDTEERDRTRLFDAELLAYRLVDVTDWVRDRPEALGRSLGYFGFGRGAPTVLWAAADPRVDIAAVVCRGERPDLAAPRLGWVRAPTLLIVGSRDDAIAAFNRRALARLRCESQLATVPGATHLFVEPDSLDTASDLATAWFVRHLTEVSGRV